MIKKLAMISLVGAMALHATENIGIAQTIDTTKIIKEGKHRPGTVLYKIKENVDPKKLKKLERLMKRYKKLEKRKLRKSNIEKITFRMQGIEKKIAKLMRETGAVDYAEVDSLIEHTAVPNDPFYNVQWHHNNIGSESAWDTTKGDGVRVCVIDTGVDTDHPDLVNNLELPGYNAYLGVSGNVEDLYGHGTGTAGTIAAVADNYEGVSGVAPDVTIVPVQISQGSLTSSAYISDMAEGIRWCADQGVQVANLSYGGAESQTISDAAQYLKDRGGILIMSAGNDEVHHNAASFPDYSSFIVVGSTDQNNNKSTFSSYGPYVDIVAPGENIATTYLNGQYVYYSGTSFSSPVVAGVAALAYSVNPNITPDEVESYLKSTATDLGTAGEDDLYGAGKVNAAATIAEVIDNSYANKLPTAVASVDKTEGDFPLDVYFEGASSYDEDGVITAYAWDFGNGDTSSQMNPSYTYNEAGSYVATLTVTDDRGAIDVSEAITVTVTEPATNALPVPVVYTDATAGYAPLTITFDGSASTDSDGQIVSYEWDFGNGDSSTLATTPYTYTNVGEYQVTLTVTDNSGAVVTSEPTTIKVLEDEPEVSLLAPEKFRRIKYGDDNVLLKWNASENATSYDVYRATKEGRRTFNYSLIGSTSERYFIQEDLEVGVYRYFIKASNGETQSEATRKRTLKVFEPELNQ